MGESETTQDEVGPRSHGYELRALFTAENVGRFIRRESAGLPEGKSNEEPNNNPMEKPRPRR